MSRNDVRVRYRVSGSAEKNAGELLLIGGQVLALRGGQVEEGYEIDLIDGPALMLQTVISLLHVAIPGGPSGVTGHRRVSWREPKRRIAVATASASAEYGPPWSLTGNLHRTSSESLAFDLRFVFVPLDPFGRNAGGKSQSMHLSGTLDYPASHAELSDDFSLAGWKVLGLGPQERKQGSSTIFDYGANAQATTSRTVGEVRAAIRKETDPGTPDPSIDLSGFWKEKCAQDFGLKIEQTGSDGMYSVSFCGPGGCFDPGTYRPNTYINKDTSYEVISAEELKIRGTDGWSSYRKCAASSVPLAK